MQCSSRLHLLVLFVLQLMYKAHEADWSRDMRGKTLITAVPLQNFFVISTQRDSDKARDFLQTLGRVGPAMGIEVNQRAQIIPLSSDRTDLFVSTIKNNLTEQTQMARDGVFCESCFMFVGVGGCDTPH